MKCPNCQNQLAEFHFYPEFIANKANTRNRNKCACCQWPRSTRGQIQRREAERHGIPLWRVDVLSAAMSGTVAEGSHLVFVANEDGTTREFYWEPNKS